MTRHLPLNQIALALAVVGLLAGSAHAGTISYSDSLTTGAAAGISTSVTYTTKTTLHPTISTAVNGVTFDSTGSATNYSETVGTGNSSNTSLSSWVPATGGVDSEIEALLTSAGPVSSPVEWTLTGLTAGESYQARLYFRTWNPNELTRILEGEFTNGAEVVSDQFSIDSPTDNNSVNGTSYSTNHDAFYVAFDYVAQGSSLVINLSSAGVPNDFGTSGTGGPHIYALSNEVTSPIPEPSTFALAALGLVGLGWFGYRRRQK